MSTNLIISGFFEDKLLEVLTSLGHKLENNPDLIIVEKLEDKSEITISQIHDLQKSLNFQPLRHSNRVVIIKNAQHLNTSSQNALLKTLEEPPVNTYFILCVDNEKKLLPTILSRCEIISFQFPILNSQFKEANTQILDWIKTGNIKEGFAWAEKMSKDRQEAIGELDILISAKDFSVIKRLLKAKKYLLSNCNIRLTLENLFLS